MQNILDGVQNILDGVLRSETHMPVTFVVVLNLFSSKGMESVVVINMEHNNSGNHTNLLLLQNSRNVLR